MSGFFAPIPLRIEYVNWKLLIGCGFMIYTMGRVMVFRMVEWGLL